MKGRQGGIVAVAVSACVCGCGCACVRVRVRVCDKTVAVLVFSLYHAGQYFSKTSVLKDFTRFSAHDLERFFAPWRGHYRANPVTSL